MSERRKRRRWTASEKLRIVLAGMESGVEVSELCRREGVNPSLCVQYALCHTFAFSLCAS